MKKAKEMIKSFATFTRLLYSSSFTDSEAEKKCEPIWQKGLLVFLIWIFSIKGKLFDRYGRFSFSDKFCFLIVKKMGSREFRAVKPRLRYSKALTSRPIERTITKCLFNYKSGKNMPV